MVGGAACRHRVRCVSFRSPTAVRRRSWSPEPFHAGGVGAPGEHETDRSVGEPAADRRVAPTRRTE